MQFVLNAARFLHMYCTLNLWPCFVLLLLMSSLTPLWCVCVFVQEYVVCVVLTVYVLSLSAAAVALDVD